MLGKTKRIETQYLWLHEAVRNNKLTVEKIPSETNSSDLGAKLLTSERSEMLMNLVNLRDAQVHAWRSCTLTPLWHCEETDKVNVRPRSSPRPRKSHVVVPNSSGKHQACHGNREYPNRSVDVNVVD